MSSLRATHPIRPIPDITGVTDLSALFFKWISIHMEVVFAKGLGDHRVQSQSEILGAVAKLAADRKSGRSPSVC